MDKYFREIYGDRKVLITGNTGFKGSWLSMWLTELGANVIGYSLEPPTEPNLFESVNLKDKIIHIIGDVRDEEHLISVFEKYQPEFVFHLAAQPLVRLSYKEPKLTYETNVMGTVSVLEAVRLTKSVRVCIIVTSDKCYENREWAYGYREIDPMGGYDPYSSSKGCAELVTSAYRRSFFNPEDYGGSHNVALSSVRAGNVIGGGDWGEARLIPDCVRSLSQNKIIAIRNPLATRPWQYVLEPLAGYLLLGALMYEDGARHSGAWNFGPNDESIITVDELVKLIIKYWGNGNYTIGASNYPHEAGLLKLDASKARALLGWKPVYDVYENIERTVNWYKNFYNGMRKEELYKFTVGEIIEYINRMSDGYR
ncbi:MAG: GDP-mannose 4,6-dehydratase [Candidatus Argoarchaeum ethanivorans]|uniref:GDP-mannose 4,6-dehydratase n=1 Tax=Candidatus Argoarchaeum ethanivorans TaxID=2608793 RepID=A0A811T6F1_9EURY|nr:MAG: GDP-mannose 4,6-dehydratase [Candidatus Argoarchaeum ethanivorans]